MFFYLHDIYTLILFGCIVSITILFLIDVKRINLLIEHPFNQKYLVTYHRFDSIFFNALVLFIYFTVLSFCISAVILKFNYIIEIDYYMLVILSLLIVYFIQVMFNMFFGNIFGYKRSYLDYFHHLLITNKLFLAIIFFPLIFIFSYINDGLLIQNYGYIIAIFFMAQYFILKLIILNRLNLLNAHSFLYIILYLYALEVAPYIVLLNFFQFIFN